MWWYLVLWAIGKLIEWLLSKQQTGQRLTADERAHVEKVIWQSNRVRQVGGLLGCRQEGQPP